VRLSFESQPDPDSAEGEAGVPEKDLTDVETKVRQQVAVSDYRPWYAWGESRVFLVKVRRQEGC
jgi:hypothetical protein